LLILTRKEGQQIRIGDDIVITLLGGRGNQYKIGIDAPRHVSVDREEIHRMKVANGQKVVA